MEAVRRLSPRAAGARLASGGDGVLRLLLLGADRAEGTSPAETAAVFEGLLRCRGEFPCTSFDPGGGAAAREREVDPGGGGGGGTLHERAMRGVARVDMVLVGPNVRLDPGVAPNAFHDVTLPSARDDDGVVRAWVCKFLSIILDQKPASCFLVS